MKMPSKWLKSAIVKLRQKGNSTGETSPDTAPVPPPIARGADSDRTSTKASLPEGSPVDASGNTAENNRPEQTTSPALEPTTPPVLDEPEGISETLEAVDHASIDAAENATTARPTLSSKLPFTAQECVEWLWDAAYDSLMDKEPELRDSYEQAVSDYVENSSQPSVESRRPSSDTRSDRDCAVRDHHQPRRTLMETCLDAFLRDHITSLADRIEGGDDVDRYVDPKMTGEEGGTSEAGGYESRSLVRDKLREAIRRSRHASLAWVASFLTLEALFLTSIPPDAAHLGAIPILAKMEWYIGLSKLVLQSDHYGVDSPLSKPNLKHSPVAILVQLYEAILSYQIRIVCCRRLTAERPQRPPIDLSEFGKYQSDIRMGEEALAGFHGQELMAGLNQMFSETMVLEQEGAAVLDESPKLLAEDENTTHVQKLLEKLEVEKQNINLEASDDSAFDDLYQWACRTQEYQKFVAWGVEPGERVLWVSGGPGTGKTKLLQAAARGLAEKEGSVSPTEAKKVAYFFCDSNRPRDTNALSAVKSLIYHILDGQPDLHNHLDSKFATTGRKRFKDPNDFYAMSLVLFALIDDERFQSTYFILDVIEELAVDEHVDLPGPLGERGPHDLVTLISRTVKASEKVRWLVSLNSDGCSAKPTLEKENMQLRLTISPNLKDIRRIAHSYATSKINDIAGKMNYKENLRKKIIETFHDAPSNFLWLDMALDIVKTSSTPWNAPSVMNDLKTNAPSLHSMYAKRIQDMDNFRQDDRDNCMNALGAAAVAYRPLRDKELEAIIHLPPEVDLKILVENMLTPFLGSYEDETSGSRRIIHFSHLSARSFIRQWLKDKNSLREQHSKVLHRCFGILLRSFNCNHDPSHINRAVEIDENSLDYAAISWIRHLSELNDDDKDATTNAIHILDYHLVQWLHLLDSRDHLSEVLVMLSQLDLALTTKSKSLGITMDSDIRQKILDVSGLLRVNQLSKTTSERDEQTLPDGNEDSWVSPVNSLLFYPSNTTLRQRLLPKYFPWLVAAPNIEHSDAVLSDNFRIMKHPDWVRECAFSPDERLVVSASDDSRVRIWDIETGKLQHVLDGPTGYIYSVAVACSEAGGRTLLAAFDFSAIWVWDLSTGRVVKVLKEAVGASRVVNRAESTDKAEGEIENEDKHADVAEEVKDDEGDEGSEEHGNTDGTGEAFIVQSISMMQDGTRLAAATGPKVTVWNLPGFEGTVWEDEGQSGQDLNRVCFSSDGRHLASSAGPVITIWDATTGKVMRRLPGRPRLPPDEDSKGSVATIGDSASVDGTPGKESPDGEEGEERAPENTAPNDEAPGDEAEAEAQAETPDRALGHSADIDGLAFSPDSKYLCSGSDDETACIWDVATGTCLAVLLYHDGPVNSVSFSPDGTYLATGSSDRTVAIWKQQAPGVWGCRATLDQPHEVLTGHSRTVRSVTFSPQGSFLASSGHDGDLRIWGRPAGMTGCVADKTTKLRSRDDGPGPGHKQEVTCVTMSPDGETIASASYDGIICLWDGATGDLQCTKEATHGGCVKALVFSSDGALLVSASVDCQAFVWNVDARSSAGLKHRLKGHEDWVRAAAVSPDSRLVATASDDRTVRVWEIRPSEWKESSEETDPERGVPVRVFRGHGDWVFSVAFSPDGRQLASASDDSHVMIWSLAVPGDKEKPDMDLVDSADSDILSQVGRVCALVFSADGRRLMATYSSGPLVVWNPGTTEDKPCLIDVEDGSMGTSIRIDRGHPDVLLTQFGAWPFRIGELASKKAEAGKLQLPRRDLPPSGAPVAISADRSWITYNNRKVIFLPREVQPVEVCWVQGHSVVLGCESGQVLLFKFSEEIIPPAGGH